MATFARSNQSAYIAPVSALALLSVALLLASLTAPVFAQEDLRNRNIWVCKAMDVPVALKDILKPGDEFHMDFTVPVTGDLVDDFPTQTGRVGLFEPPGKMIVSFVSSESDAGLIFGETVTTLHGLEDGAADIVAVGATEADLEFFEWRITTASMEFRKDAGDAFDGVNQWPDTAAIDWDISRCGFDFEDPNTQQVYPVTGFALIEPAGSTIRRIVHVEYGDLNQLIAEIQTGNSFARSIITRIEFVGDASIPFLGLAGHMGSENLLGTIVGNIELSGSPLFEGESIDSFRLATVADGARLSLIGAGAVKDPDYPSGLIQNFSVNGNGGAFKLEGNASLSLHQYTIKGTSALFSGGAIHRSENAVLFLLNSSVIECTAGVSGGAVAIEGGKPFEEDRLPAKLSGNRFSDNSAVLEGCELFIQSDPQVQLEVQVENSSITNSECETGLILNNNGNLLLQSNGIIGPLGGTNLSLRGISHTRTRGTYSVNLGSQFRLNSADQRPPKTEAACEPADAQGFESLGYNITDDDSCTLDQPTDLPNTDPLLSVPDEFGVSTPLPGSPAIDHGPAELVTLGDENDLVLPCGWVDINGTARPQDGNGDGIFECDTGPVEVPGTGAIQAGHSGAFFNPVRNGEGEYVEIWENGSAVIFTFTYQPDGSGPAWMIALATVEGNSLIANEVLQPVGTAWGDGFDGDTIEYTDWGGMSMVFPGCTTADTPGNVNFSGNRALDYEALTTKAVRGSDIAGCDASTTPSPFAHRSGSYFDAARNGEGLVVQWLPDGRVLAIMFTFGPDGEQMWILGLGQADGNSVTIDALYPAGSTSWGSDFKAGEVVLEAWGTFTLTWTGNDSLTFDFESPVAGYGSGSLAYQRISQLLGLPSPE